MHVHHFCLRDPAGYEWVHNRLKDRRVIQSTDDMLAHFQILEIDLKFRFNNRFFFKCKFCKSKKTFDYYKTFW